MNHQPLITIAEFMGNRVDAIIVSIFIDLIESAIQLAVKCMWRCREAARQRKFVALTLKEFEKAMSNVVKDLRNFVDNGGLPESVSAEELQRVYYE